MRKKRIAIFGVKYFPSRGGTSRVVENLLWQMKEDFDFTIYCYEHPEAATHIPGVKTIQFPEVTIKGIGVFWYYMRCCFHLMKQDKYDLVHVHKTDAAFFLPILQQKFKVIATSHALPYMNDKWSSIGKTYFRLVERLFMTSESTLTAISKPQADFYQQKYNRSIHYIPNGIHPVQKVFPERIEELIKKHNIQPNYLLFAARRVIPLKGCHTLIEALKNIGFKGTLVVAGDTEQLPSYTQKLKKAAKGIDVKFIGYIGNREELNALIHRAGLFLFPSEIEGMSMMLLEVGSVGTPMICSDIPQNKAVLSNEEVLYFKSKDARDLAEKLTWAMSHPLVMQHKAENAKHKIATEYQVSVVVQQYADLYEQVVATREKYCSPPILS